MASTPLASAPSRNGHQADEPPAGEQSSLLTRAARGLASQVQKRIPRADLDERDSDYIREQLPWMWMLASVWFRGEVRGLGNIPDSGPVLLVGNHSGGNLTPDTGIFTLAFTTFFGVERRFYQLALDSGAALLVYPGGDYEVHRPSWESGKIDFGGRKGFIQLALDRDVPVVPVVSIGGQETSLFLTRGERLARLLMVDRLARLKVLPISIGLPWGLNVGDMLGHIPLPAKITIETLPAIDLRKEFGPDPDVQEIYDHLIRLMQDTLDALASERRFPVIG